MSYLNNSTVVVDAILTKRGRELMSQGKLNITKFALADDEIDYTLYNLLHPQGSEYYGAAIENLPILEAFPDGTKLMKYKLITLPKGTSVIPIINVSSTSVTLLPGTRHLITPSTLNGLNSTYGYSATLLDSTYVTLNSLDEITVSDNTLIEGSVSNLSVTKRGKTFELIGKSLPSNISTASTKLLISGNETGGVLEIDITINSVTVVTVGGIE